MFLFTQDGKLRPGIYKIQNIVGQTYVEVNPGKVGFGHGDGLRPNPGIPFRHTRGIRKAKVLLSVQSSTIGGPPFECVHARSPLS
jgi:hypothetical protein